MRVPLAILTVLLLPGLAASDDAAASAQASDKQAAEAKRAKERPKAPVKVYTDEDLKKARENPSSNVTLIGSPDAPAPSSAGEPAETGRGGGNELGTGESTPQMDRRLDEATWRGMARESWGAVRAAEARIRELEAQIEELLLGDRNPSPPDLLDPSRLQKREAARVEAEKNLAEARNQLATARQGVESLQERARAAAVPQSWVEEPAPEPEPQG